MPSTAAPEPAVAPASAPAGIDWSQVWYPGPRRVFTASEMAEYGADRPSRTLWLVCAANLATLAAVLAMLAPPASRAAVLVFSGVLVLEIVAAALWVWRRPWRRGLAEASFALAIGLVVPAIGVRHGVDDPVVRSWVAVVLGGGCAIAMVLLWFVAVWRSQEIESRLRARREREQAVEMARRLAAAQLEPHFLFNTLASVQHWVATGDARAAQMLAALTDYLRSTLPMFRRPLLTLGEELSAVRPYLELMRLRLGDRLQVEIDVPAALLGQPLPPGLVLTLVENAIRHGIEPLLGGGRLCLRAHRDDTRVVLEVLDNGPGPGASTPHPGAGTGLANARERLALAHGPGHCGIELLAAAGGGSCARLSWPHEPEPAPIR